MVDRYVSLLLIIHSNIFTNTHKTIGLEIEAEPSKENKDEYKKAFVGLVKEGLV